MTNIVDTNEVLEVPRAQVVSGSDVQVLFAKRDDNSEFRVDVFGVKDVETGKTFGLRLMAYEGKTVWRLQSAYRLNDDVWSYRTDARVKAGFKGKVMLGATGGKTYAVYIANDRIEAVVPLLDLLHNRLTNIKVADFGRLRVAFAKIFMVDANLSKEEDEAVNFRETEVCRKNGLRLVKFVHISGGAGIYRVYREKDGQLVESHLRTLSEGYLAIGHVPRAPQTAPGTKTNVAPSVGDRKKKVA
jgi:hypothetical protein